VNRQPFSEEETKTPCIGPSYQPVTTNFQGAPIWGWFIAMATRSLGAGETLRLQSSFASIIRQLSPPNRPELHSFNDHRVATLTPNPKSRLSERGRKADEESLFGRRLRNSQPMRDFSDFVVRNDDTRSYGALVNPEPGGFGAPTSFKSFTRGHGHPWHPHLKVARDQGHPSRTWGKGKGVPIRFAQGRLSTPLGMTTMGIC